MTQDNIVIKGAREHNLKGIDLVIPRNKLVVITGLSGSGKSSLAFDTIYAEGQRRYVESLSAYARQFLEQMEKPDVDFIEGLSPAISIEQKFVSKNPRSTVGTVTELYDYLRLLFARIGKPYCYSCGRIIASQTVQQMVDQLMKLDSGTKIQVLSPVVRSRKGEYQKLLEKFRQSGFVRVRIDNETFDLSDDIKLDKNKKHDIELIVDRIVIRDNVEKRLADSLEIALKYGDGITMIDVVDSEKLLFSEHSSCVYCGISYPEITHRLFSFNNPQGACPQCGGLGFSQKVDKAYVIPDPDKSLMDGAITPWENTQSVYYYQMLECLAKHFHFDLYKPFKELAEEHQNIILYGSGKEEIEFHYEDTDRQHYFKKPFEGVIPSLERRYSQTQSDYVRQDIGKFMSETECNACNGKRLRPESLSIKIADYNIIDITSMSIKNASEFFANLSLNQMDYQVAERILNEINERLKFMMNVGLDYLTLDRASASLSGGESQRIRLATQIGSSLVGVLYILDEPSIGLHQRDNSRLIETLIRLRDIGNTVIVVEHDEETIRTADFIVDLGPGAGENGGYLVCAGDLSRILNSPESLTGQYLSGEKSIPIPAKRRIQGSKKLIINGARENNLKNIKVEIPVGLFTCVTGVSGSGKSSLIKEILYKTMMKKIYKSHIRPGDHDEIIGSYHFDKVIDIDQSPIGRTPRSNPATYTGVFTDIRDIFAKVPEAKMRGFSIGRFSFNVKGGRCEACQGDGIKKIEMHFLPDIYVTCEVCKGKRYDRETLEVRYKGKNIAEVLEMTISQALEFFDKIPKIKNKLKTLTNVGLDYIRLGQPATTLSGGEAQRVKLSKELSKISTGRTLYLLDEPTTGLHFADIQKLLEVLNSLADAGNTIVVIEHNLDVIKNADYIIDLGPEGGDNGGYVVATGTPEEIAKNSSSYTGMFLKKMLLVKKKSKLRKGA
jgi:excinuclease ABC subunit A